MLADLLMFQNPVFGPRRDIEPGPALKGFVEIHQVLGGSFECP